MTTVEPAREALFTAYAIDHGHHPKAGITNDDVYVMLQELRDQAEEIQQLRRDLADANERALGPDERGSAAIQVAELMREWRTKLDTLSHPTWREVGAALDLWETVR
jgi:hypothetical protein